MLVYVWSRRNPYVRMNFFGLLNFQAPYLPWVLLAFSLLLGNAILVDLMGIAVGHIYYFLEDVFPNQSGGFRILETPKFMWVAINCLSNTNPNIGSKCLFEYQTDEPTDERPERFDFNDDNRD